MKKAYLGYTKHLAMLDKGVEAPRQPTRFSDSDLTYTTSGVPQVPAAIKNINGVETSLTQQQIIRSYLKAHYGQGHLNQSTLYVHHIAQPLHLERVNAFHMRRSFLHQKSMSTQSIFHLGLP